MANFDTSLISKRRTLQEFLFLVQLAFLIYDKQELKQLLHVVRCYHVFYLTNIHVFKIAIPKNCRNPKGISFRLFIHFLPSYSGWRSTDSALDE